MVMEHDDVFRAQGWNEYIGQEELKRKMMLEIRGTLAKPYTAMLPHVFISAPPGFGKTTLAQIIADELGDNFASLTMPIKPDALPRFLRGWDGGVLLLDELHSATRQFQEDLMPWLESGYLRLPNGRHFPFPGVTIIGATTEPEKIIPALYDKFPIKPKLAPYSEAELALIVQGMAKKLKLDLTEEVVTGLGAACGGTPRYARRLVLAADTLRWNEMPITVDAVLEQCDLDRDGLTADHLDYLKALYEVGGVAGLDKIANMVRMHHSILKELERVLISKGFITYGPQGREITQTGTRKVLGEQQPTRARRRAA